MTTPWIPCGEATPAHGDKVLVATLIRWPEGGRPEWEVTMALYVEGYPHLTGYTQAGTNRVLHPNWWMPPPAPPPTPPRDRPPARRL